MMYHEETEIPHAFLGKSSLNISEVKLLFAPNSEMSREIMKKIEMLSPLKGIKYLFKCINTKVVEDEKAIEDEKAMMASAQESYLDIIGVVFQDEISYRLRFPAYRTTGYIELSIVQDVSKLYCPILIMFLPFFVDTCFNFSSMYCENPMYWTRGFVSLQSSIDSALIEVSG
ncbi:hypothetical protein E2320_016252 [Naja naja]|nr:hypothetical protein E2320_016252 [Naja naja]